MNGEANPNRDLLLNTEQSQEEEEPVISAHKEPKYKASGSPMGSPPVAAKSILKQPT